jgi:aspartate-semialdehyde dehydrogenase
MKVVIAGTTGAVGREFLRVLEERNFPVTSLTLLASERSEGRKLQFKGEQVPVVGLSANSFDGAQIAFFSVGAEMSREIAPSAVKAGAVVIDNSSAFRMEPDVPLVVPEVNPETVKDHKGIIANPNCSTIIMVVAIAPIHRAAGIRQIIVATYQAVSGTGYKAIEELRSQVSAIERGEPIECEAYPHQIAFNLFPHIDDFLENGYTKEEMKMTNETRKILQDQSIRISATCVRVPVYRAHSEAVHLSLKKRLTAEEARRILRNASGVKLLDSPGENVYPTPLIASGTYFTYVGRIREDIALENGLALWVVADQLLKGAALNAVQIAELLIK